MDRSTKMLMILSSIFISMLVVSNIIAIKSISIGGLVGPAAVICYSLTFAITDSISEVWGRKTTQFVVYLGFVSVVISAIFVRLAIVMPGAEFWSLQDEFKLIMGSNMRIVLASLLAYLISQTHDVFIFHYIKQKTGGKHLWLRNNVSSILSQLLDTVVFIVVGFAGLGIPLWDMIVGQFVIKIIIAIIDTPLVYGIVRIIKAKR